MKVSVLGCGRWGGFLAWYNHDIGNDTMLWGLADAPSFTVLRDTRQNEYLQLPEGITLTSDLAQAVAHADIIIIAISSQYLRGFLNALKAFDLSNKKFLLNMKGVEASTGKRLSQVFEEELGENIPVAVWVGPGHIQDFLRGIPNCMIIDSKSVELTKSLVDIMISKRIRFYYGQDLIGSEIGAASKNVIGIAAGMLDGLGYTSLKGALMARAPRELSRLIEALGGNPLSIYGLAHLGDYEATLFSPHSHNRKYGEGFVKGEKNDKLAEGVDTVKAMMALSQQTGVDLPICNAVYNILHEHKPVEEALTHLFLRETKFEFFQA
ncbi:MAG: NAD(P)H-dependent glycerol-3-phosphate dehydrogenase [Hyphomonadaceae bacterium]|nr:NAD(P)H-dependent glycerol-3-phosphate dehydrogenase [Clostridia bacterium]